MSRVTRSALGVTDVRVGCVFEELGDEVGGAFEGDGLTGRGLRGRHGGKYARRWRVGREYSRTAGRDSRREGDHVPGSV